MTSVSNAVAPYRLDSRSIALNAGLVLGASLLIAISAQIAIPFPLVPLTMQPFALLLLGGLLGPRRAALSATLYLLEGAAGLPVFANMHAGAATLIGPTAGFLYAFPLAAMIAGLRVPGFWSRFGVMLAAVAALYIGGWSWLVSAWHFSPSSALASGVTPFIAADVVKAAIAAVLIETLRRRHTR